MTNLPPTISILIPTLNAAKTLSACLQSIYEQQYPQDNIEIIIADGGSTDDTLKIAKEYHARIVTNPLKTGESGKAVALKHAHNDLIALIDSDNILPDPHWLQTMVAPFDDNSIVLTEPMAYTYHHNDPWLTRYFALLGMNDPICLFIGNYDRTGILSPHWTSLSFPEQDMGDYLKVTLNQLPIPTIGANGTLLRKNSLKKLNIEDYLFDIDIPIKLIKLHGSIQIAKVKTSIVHTFVEDSPGKFFRKQLRRIDDWSFHQSKTARETNWQGQFFWKVVWFQLQCVLIFPILWQTALGFFKTQDFAWLFHPIAIYSTWLIYLYGWVKGKIIPKESDRKNWKQ